MMSYSLIFNIYFTVIRLEYYGLPNFIRLRFEWIRQYHAPVTRQCSQWRIQIVIESLKCMHVYACVDFKPTVLVSSFDISTSHVRHDHEQNGQYSTVTKTKQCSVIVSFTARRVENTNVADDRNQSIGWGRRARLASWHQHVFKKCQNLGRYCFYLVSWNVAFALNNLSYGTYDSSTISFPNNYDFIVYFQQWMDSRMC